jgi:hypothetical protein
LFKKVSISRRVKMAYILVSLISEQTLPNLLMIKELKEIDQYLFISTKVMETKKKTEHIINAAQVDIRNKCKTVIVEEDSLPDILAKLEKLDFDDDDHFYINLTGGNKIMAIGVYEYFKNRKSQIFYIPVGKNKYRKIFPHVKNREKPIEYRLKVDEYLKSYGIESIFSKLRQDRRTSERTEEFFSWFINADKYQKQILNNLREFRSKKKIIKNDCPEIFKLIGEIPFNSGKRDSLSKYEIKYLSGDWLEDLVYNRIKSITKLGNNYIKQDVQIKIQETSNQFDVMFVIDNVLYLIECKTDIFDLNTDKNILNDTLYKISALKHKFGLTPRSFIMTLSHKGTSEKCIKESHIERAETLGVQIFDKTMFLGEFENNKFLSIL